MIIEPLALLPTLVFYRNKHTWLLLNNISKARKTECFAVEVQLCGLHLPISRRMSPRLMNALVSQRPFQHKFVDQCLPLHKLVVKLARTILQRIERGDGNCLHMRCINHCSPSWYAVA